MKKTIKYPLIIGTIVLVLLFGYFIMGWHSCFGCGQSDDFYEEQKARSIQKQIEEQLLTDPDSGISVTKLKVSAMKITLEKGEETIAGFGVKNVLPEPLNFKVEFEEINCESELDINYDQKPQNLNITDSLTMTFIITEKEKNNYFGTCLYKVSIINLDTEESYAEESFFIQII